MKTTIQTASAEGIERAAAALRAGALVAIPTETVYGLAADAMNEAAVARIFEAKGRPRFDPLIVHVARSALSHPEGPIAGLVSRGVVSETALSAPWRARVEALMRALWPGPLTLVLPKGARVPGLVTSGLETVAVRMPAHPVAQAVLEASGCALAAPSANRFGRISPTRAEHVLSELGEHGVAMILDGGACEVGVESTIVAVSGDGPARLLRPGGAPLEAIEAALGAPLLRQPSKASPSREAPESPGQLESHYAPSKPLTLLPASLDQLDDEALRAALGTGDARVGLLRPVGSSQAARERLQALGVEAPIVYSLSERGDWIEAARKLFATLRALDDSEATRLLAEPVCENEGSLALAIADRLARASA